MGEVYRATDTKLGRDIALKVLPAEMAQDPERLGRFRREAKALAQLDHPNIVTIHSVEECGGIHFLTMQLVEGLPLDRLIPEDGLPVEQIVEIATALGDALAAAHEKGIVHRDLKPANVMVSNDGRVKVLDFGLAKDIRAANLSDATMTSDSRTQVGVVMGTPAYMSPEQTSGRALDHRTDIFSMGVLIHEMATGRRPFEGSSTAELRTCPAILPALSGAVWRKIHATACRRLAMSAMSFAISRVSRPRKCPPPGRRSRVSPPHPTPLALAPTKASGSRYCHSSTAEETPTSRHSQKD
jgi:serine/threonine protein kinase